jgi:hypothetical protein
LSRFGMPVNAYVAQQTSLSSQRLRRAGSHR